MAAVNGQSVVSLDSNLLVQMAINEEVAPRDEGEFLVMLVDSRSGDSCIAWTSDTREQAEQDAIDWLDGHQELRSFILGCGDG